MTDRQDNSGISFGPGLTEVRNATLEAEVGRLREAAKYFHAIADQDDVFALWWDEESRGEWEKWKSVAGIEIEEEVSDD